MTAPETTSQQPEMADGMALVARWDGCTCGQFVVGGWPGRPVWRQCSLETPAPEGVSGGNGMVAINRTAGMRIPTELASISTLAIVCRPLSAASERQSQKDWHLVDTREWGERLRVAF